MTLEIKLKRIKTEIKSQITSLVCRWNLKAEYGWLWNKFFCWVSHAQQVWQILSFALTGMYTAELHQIVKKKIKTPTALLLGYISSVLIGQTWLLSYVENIIGCSIAYCIFLKDNLKILFSPQNRDISFLVELMARPCPFLQHQPRWAESSRKWEIVDNPRAAQLIKT